MMKPYATHTVTMNHIEKLEKDVGVLHRKITDIRARMAPLTEKMEKAYEEYQNAIRPFHFQYLQIISDIELLGRGTGKGPKEDYKGRSPGNKEQRSTEEHDAEPGGPMNGRKGNIIRNQEFVRKEELLEFLVWVLDDQSKDNQKLLGNLTGMIEMPSVRLADMLERIPPVLLGQSARVDEEDLPGWYDRLQTWREALNQRMITLEWEEGKLQNNDKYKLVQQYEQGGAVWKTFINNEMDKFKRKIEQAEAELKTITDRGAGQR